MAQHYEYLAAAFVALCTLAGIALKYRGDRKAAEERAAAAEAETRVYAREMEAQAYFLSFGAYLHEWQSIEHEALAIINETEVDRILLFQAWNGEHDPRHTTAVCQFRAEGQTLVSYRSVKLDLDYQIRIRKMEENGGHHFTVSAIPESMIKDVYEAEGVKSSYWLGISKLAVPGTKSVAIGYASYASHEASVITRTTQTRCRLLNDRLAILAEKYEGAMVP